MRREHRPPNTPPTRAGGGAGAVGSRVKPAGSTHANRSTAKPNPATDPASTAKPNPATDPASTAKPNPATDPASTAKPNPATDPASTAKPNPATDPASESGYGPGEYGEAESGYGPGEYGEAESGYGPGQYGEAESGYGPGQYGEAESGYGPGQYGEAEGEGEEQFLPFLPIIGKVLGGLLGGLGKEAESSYAGEYSEAEAPYGEVGEVGEAEEQFLHQILTKVLGQEAEAESLLSASQEAEFASQLMEVNSEAEMDELLGRIVNTIGRAVQGVAGAANSRQGRALIEAVKPLARSALPAIGGAIGSAFAPGVGTQIGATFGSAASNLFEMEVPGQSEAEQQFEVARRVVRLTSAAAADVASAPAGAPAELVGEFSLVRAASRLARPLFGRALRAISPVARGFYGRRYGAYGYRGGYRGYRAARVRRLRRVPGTARLLRSIRRVGSPALLGPRLPTWLRSSHRQPAAEPQPGPEPTAPHPSRASAGWPCRSAPRHP